jgi:hypothetical protein
MALYLGSNKLKANMNGIAYCLNLFSSIAVNNGIRLLSSEGYVLKDANGIYLIPKESDK